MSEEKKIDMESIVFETPTGKLILPSCKYLRFFNTTEEEKKEHIEEFKTGILSDRIREMFNGDNLKNIEKIIGHERKENSGNQ